MANTAQADPNERFLKSYPESATPTLEGLKLMANARRRFFLIAEDDISVPPFRWDDASGQLQDGRNAIAQEVTRDREALCKKYPDSRMAKAKLAGAYVNEMGVLADEALLLNAAHNNEGFEKKCREIGELHIKTLPLLPHVHLKGRKKDVDQVLGALFGEVAKAAYIDNGIIHHADAVKGLAAMRQADTLTDWIKKLMQEDKRFSTPDEKGVSCLSLLDTLRSDVKTTLGLHPEDAARDEVGINIRDTFSELNARIKAMVKEDGQKGKTKSRAIGLHVSRACTVLDEMLLQDEKKVSTGIVLAIGQADALTDTLKSQLDTLPADAVSDARKTLTKLHRATELHLINTLTHGREDSTLNDEFQTAAKNASLVSVHAPEHLPEKDKKKYEEINASYHEGVTLMHRLAPDLSLEDPHPIRKKMDAVTSEVNAFVASHRVSSKVQSRGA